MQTQQKEILGKFDKLCDANDVATLDQAIDGLSLWMALRRPILTEGDMELLNVIGAVLVDAAVSQQKRAGTRWRDLADPAIAASICRKWQGV